MFPFIFFIWIYALFTSPLYAQENEENPAVSEVSLPVTTSSWWKSLSFSLGNYSPQAGLLQEDDRGQKNLYETHLFLSLSSHHFVGPLYLWPEVIWVFPQEGTGGHIYKTTLITRLDGGYFLTSHLQGRFGGGLQHTFMQGKGGRASIQNGNGQTSFFVPSLTKYIQQTSLDVGIEWFIRPQFSLRLTTELQSPFESLTRTWSYLFFLTWHLESPLEYP
jgi:hypothetical protein